MHKVSIKNVTDGDIRPTHVSIDGQPIRAVSVNFSQSVDAVPTCEIEIRALPDIEALADVRLCFTPKAVHEAAVVVRHTLLTDERLYTALIASIYSALKTLPRELDLKSVAKAVADRIIGEQ